MPTQFLHSIRKSETVNCWRCKTRQYPRNGACVRCHCALKLEYLRIAVKWATDSGDVGQGRSEATLVVFLQ